MKCTRKYCKKTVIVSNSRGGTHKKILVNRFPPFFLPQLNCGLAITLIFFFFGTLPACFKKKDKSPEERRSAKNASRPCPRSLPMVQEYTMYSYSRTDFGNAATWGQKLPMQLHCLIFASSFFTPQTFASAQARCW